MYAVLETGGKQYKVEEGDILYIEKIEGEIDSLISFDNVLLVASNDSINFGSPLLDGVSVSAKVLAQGKGKKIIVFKYKAKKNYKKKQGHRQLFTKVQIEKINVA